MDLRLDEDAVYDDGIARSKLAMERVFRSYGLSELKVFVEFSPAEDRVSTQGLAMASRVVSMILTGSWMNRCLEELSNSSNAVKASETTTKRFTEVNPLFPRSVLVLISRFSNERIRARNALKKGFTQSARALLKEEKSMLQQSYLNCVNKTPDS